jgi:hypothetical protein
MKWRLILIVGLSCAVFAGLIVWLQHARLVGSWLQVHTGTVNESGPYYGFWSGFGSDLEEFGILGAIGAAIYQLVKKYRRSTTATNLAAGESATTPRQTASSTSVIATTRTSTGKSQLVSSSSACTVRTWSARLPFTANSRKSIST